MLWSLLKILAFISLVAAAAFGVQFLLGAQAIGNVQVTVLAREYTLQPLQALIALMLLVIAIWLFLKLLALAVAVLKFINGDETAISRYFDRNRERKGYQALSEGMMALASGEGRLALSKASRAEKYLAKPELTNLLTAQAAEMAGDRRKAEDVYKKMVQNDATRFVGVRGLMKQKLADGDTRTALKLAERAFAIKPKHEETQDVLLKLQAQLKDWSGARKTLGAKLKHGNLPRDVHKRRDAVLALSEAKNVIDDGQSIEAREAAIEANRLSPDLIPAAVMAARSLIEQGKQKNASRIITKAWAAQPHPDLAAVFAEIEPNETPAARIKRFGKLVKSTADHRESRLLMAELNIAAEDFPAARRALGNLYETEPDVRTLTVMAAIERGEGKSDAVVKGWLARAVTASRGPQWVCDHCHNIQAEWTPVCDNCQSFDTLSWKTPPSAGLVLPTGSEMLPLIIGAMEETADLPAIIEDDPDIVDAEATEEKT